MYFSLGDSHRAKVPAIFAAEFDIEGCETSQQVKTYRIETKRGTILFFSKRLITKGTTVKYHFHSSYVY